MPIPALVPILSAALGAIPSIYQGVVGARQLREGRRGLANLERPEYNIPTGIEQSLALAQQQAADPYMPGENIMRNRAAMATANAFRNASQAGNPMAVVGQLQANENRAMQNIGIASAEQQNADMRRLQDMYGIYAKYQDQQWQMNEFAPYAQKYNEFREQVGAGQQNIFGALDRVSAVGATFLNAYAGTGITPQPQSTGAAQAVEAQNQNSLISNIFAQGIQGAAMQAAPLISRMGYNFLTGRPQ